MPWVYQDYNQRYPITNDIGEQVLDKYFELKSKQESNDTQAKNKTKLKMKQKQITRPILGKTLTFVGVFYIFFKLFDIN